MSVFLVKENGIRGYGTALELFEGLRVCQGVCLATNFVCKYSKVWSLDLAPERFDAILFGSLARPWLAWVSALTISVIFVIFDHI